MKEIKDSIEHDLIVGSREIFAVGDIDDEFYSKLLKNICLLQYLKTAPITIYLSTQGGDLSLSLGLYDKICSLPFEVKMIVLGDAFSGGSLLLQSADIRLMSKHSVLMIHDLQNNDLSGKIEDISSVVKFSKKQNNYMLDIYEEKSNLTVQQLKHKFSGPDWYLSSDEALELGFIDDKI